MNQSSDFLGLFLKLIFYFHCVFVSPPKDFHSFCIALVFSRTVFPKVRVGAIPYTALGAQINPSPLFLIFHNFLSLALAGGSNLAGP